MRLWLSGPSSAGPRLRQLDARDASTAAAAMLLLLLLVMVSTGLAKAIPLALARLATLFSLRMTLVRWSRSLPTRTCSLRAPPQNRSRLCSSPKVARGARNAYASSLERARGVGMGCLCHV